MKDRKNAFVKLVDEVSVKTDDSGSTIIVHFEDELSEYRYCFEWNLNDQMHSKEFGKFLTVVLSSIEIELIAKGDFANGNFDLAVGNTNTSFYFWAASKEPYRESHFLTPDEVSKLFSEDYRKMFLAKLDGEASVKTGESGTTIVVPFGDELSEGRCCFEWNLNDQMYSKEFEKFLTTVLSSIKIALIAKGDFANGNFDLAVGNTNTLFYFWAASKEPYKEGSFLTLDEVSELFD